MLGTAECKRIIAIGDIHGMLDEFVHLLGYLQDRFSPEDTRFILLGDIIDRGPDTPGVVSKAINLFDRYPGSQLILGNHDAYLLMMLNREITEFELNQWAHMGGLDTMHAYLYKSPKDIDAIREQILEVAPRHYNLLNEAVSMVVTPRHCFVHAGIDPSRSLHEQEPATTRWIRRGFLDYSGALEKVVVHGHSITPSFLPELFANRIALDSGSYKSNRISAAIFEDDALTEFACVRRHSGFFELLRFDNQMSPLL